MDRLAGATRFVVPAKARHRPSSLAGSLVSARSVVHWEAGAVCEDELWEAAYERFETPEEEIRKFMRRFRRLGIDALPRSARVVELFCGRGNGLVALERLGFDSLEGVDLSSSLVSRYRGPAQLYVGDCRRLGFEADSKDSGHHPGRLAPPPFAAERRRSRVLRDQPDPAARRSGGNRRAVVDTVLTRRARRLRQSSNPAALAQAGRARDHERARRADLSRLAGSAAAAPPIVGRIVCPRAALRAIREALVSRPAAQI